MKNTFKIEVLEDGTISVDTEGFDAAVHKSADDFVKMLGELLGGPVTVKEKRSHAKSHTHTHSHDHTHHHH